MPWPSWTDTAGGRAEGASPFLLQPPYRKVKIILPLTQDNVGNIFGEEDGTPHWSDIEIPCEIDCNESDFDEHKLRANSYPDYMAPTNVCW